MCSKLTIETLEQCVKVINKNITAKCNENILFNVLLLIKISWN